MDTTCAIGIDRSIEELTIEFLGYAYVTDIQGALVSIRNPFLDLFADKIFSIQLEMIRVQSEAKHLPFRSIQINKYRWFSHFD